MNLTSDNAGSENPSEREARQWAMFLHLSLLAGWAVPVAGLLAPILIWQLKKEEFPVLEEHGKVVLNWVFSLFLYSLISAILVFVFVGIFLLIAIGVLSIVFPIIGGLKANEGVLWRYPLSLPFV
jgi:hypothetical protein